LSEILLRDNPVYHVEYGARAGWIKYSPETLKHSPLLHEAESDEFEKTRQASLDIDTKRVAPVTPAQQMSQNRAQTPVIFAGELIADVLGQFPLGVQRMLDAVMTFRRGNRYFTKEGGSPVGFRIRQHTKGQIMSIRKSLSACFSSAALIWPALFTSLFVSLVLYVPPQVHELYRILLQDGDFLRAVVTLGFLCLLFFVITLMGRALLLTTKPHAFGAGGSDEFIARCLPVACGSLVLLATASGLIAASADISRISISQAAMMRSTSLAQIADLASASYSAATKLRFAGVAVLLVCVFLLFFFGRRSYRTSHLAQAISNHGRRTWIGGLGAAVVLSMLFTIFNGLAASVGTIAILCIFASVLATVVTGLQIDSYRKAPLLAFVCFGAFLFSLFGWNDNHVIHETALKTARPVFNVSGPQLEFESWYRSRKDLQHFTEKKMRYPVFIIAARGGGIYAAAQEALFLSRMQDQCPNFAQHVFAISGVSGGALGAALFNGLTRKYVTNNGWEPCKLGVSQTGQLEQHSQRFLQTDFLSPIIAATLFPDFLQRFLPFAISGTDRGAALSSGLERAWRNTEPDGDNPFEGMFLDHWDSTSAAPALLLNTTEVDNGRRIVIAPFAFTPLRDPAYSAQAWFYQTAEMSDSLKNSLPEPKVTKDIRLSEAAGTSARFPWILPAVTIKREDKILRLVDGGYFDNSGIETALDVIEVLVGVRKVHQQSLTDASGKPDPFDFDIHLITISGSLEDGAQPWQGMDDLLSPVRALLSSREARGVLSALKVQTGEYIYGSGSPTFDVRPAAMLDEQDMAMALGFELSKKSIALIGAQVGEADQDGKIWGDASVQEAETKDRTITRSQHRIMDNVQANSYTACEVKYWLNAQHMPTGSFGSPCDGTTAQQP
jgi:hypothetical protein